MPAGRCAGNRWHKRAAAGRPGIEAGAVAEILTGTPDPLRARCAGGGDGEVPGSVQLHEADGQAVRCKPPDQAAVVRPLAESAGGSPERYYQMSGQDEMGIFGQPGSHTRAAVSPAATSPGAFTRFETHELIEASDLTASAEPAQGIAYHPLAPGKHASCSPDYPGLTGTDIDPIRQDGLTVSRPRHCQDHRRGHAARAGPPPTGPGRA
jgi:hypothetical protein